MGRSKRTARSVPDDFMKNEKKSRKALFFVVFFISLPYISSAPPAGPGPSLSRAGRTVIKKKREFKSG
jgi:hypothetical protein